MKINAKLQSEAHKIFNTDVPVLHTATLPANWRGLWCHHTANTAAANSVHAHAYAHASRLRP